MSRRLELPRGTLRREDATAIWLPVWATVGSRLVIWAAALSALAVFGVRGIAAQPGLTQPFGSHAVNFLLAPALRYDAAWYLHIAQSGYFSRSATAFFPMYPLLLKLGGAVLASEQIAGLLISFSATLVALGLLHALTRIELGDRAARTSVWLVAFFPTSLFLSAVYTEALFLALSIGALLAARRERWMWAGILAGFASATRSSGILLCLPLALMYLYGPRDRGRRRLSPSRWSPRFRVESSAGWLAIGAAGLLAYIGYLAIARGTPLAPFGAEQAWGREFAGPLGAVFAALVALPGAVAHILAGTQDRLGAENPLGWQTYQLIDLGFLAFALVGLWQCWRRLPVAYFAYALVALTQALSYPVAQEPLKSFSRYLLVIFPLFMAWGSFLSERMIGRRVMLGTCGLVLAGFSGLWGIWGWVA